MVAAAHPAGNAALLVNSGAPPGAAGPPPRSPNGQATLTNFLHTASPEALRLAVLAATSEATTLAVLRAIQQELLPGSGVSDLAEVLVSGIFQHVPGNSGPDLRVRMNSDCRAGLQALASLQDRWDVYRAVSAAIQRASPESASSFHAVIHDPQGDITVVEGQQAFAEIARSALSQATGALTGQAPQPPTDLPPRTLHDALASTAAISDPGARAQALTELAAHLSADERSEVLAQAVAAAAAISDPGARAQALTELAAHLSADERSEVLAQAVAAAAAISDPGARTQALTELAAHLSADERSEVLAQAVAAAAAISDPGARTQALTELAAHLSADERSEVLAQAVAAAAAISDPGARTQALTELAAHLSADERSEVLAQAVAAAAAISDPGARAQALTELAAHLSADERSEVLAQAVAAAAAISDPGARTQALTELAAHLSADERSEVLAQAVAAAAAISDPGARAQALTELAAHLSADERSEVLAQAVAAAAAISDPGARTQALTELAAHLSADERSEVLAQAVAAAAAISDPGARAQALTELAAHLSADERSEVLAQAVAAAAAISDPGARTQALTELAAHLSADERSEVLAQAVAAAAAISDPGARTQALTELAAHLSADERSEVLAQAPSSVGADSNQSFFAAELENHPMDQPLRTGKQYTIAFSVRAPAPSAIATVPFADEVLAGVWRDVAELDLIVQLNSDDFEILGDSTRQLRVLRTGKPLGKARFDIAPWHDGECRLVASVHYKGNFVQQMEVMILVDGRGRASVEMSGRGRPPGSGATQEPRDVAIVLEPAPSGGFTCTLMGSVTGRAVLPITATELASAVDSARQAMMSVLQAQTDGELVFQTGIDIPDLMRDWALSTLARAGALLFHRLFLHPAAAADARVIGEWLRDQATDPGSRLKIQVVADQAPLPWALLYIGDASKGAELSWNNFLGMRHIIEQLPLRSSLSTQGNKILSSPKLTVSLNVNISVDQSMGTTLVADHLQHWRDTAAARRGLALVSRSTATEVVRALADRATGDQIMYFFCHGRANANPLDAEIIMGRNDRVTLADLQLDAPETIQLAGNPLVVMNISADPLFYSGFVPYFMAKGARGVIGAEFALPVLFAIEWADAFFDRFLDGTTVGETVLTLRQDFLREHSNPLGLIYAVHCDADTSVAPPAGRLGEEFGQETV